MVEHNTTLSNAPAGWVLGGDATIERNLVLATEPPVLTSTSPQAALGTIGDNWYGPTAAAQTDVCVFSVDGSDLDFTQWTMAGFDPDSACDAIPGVAIPALDDVATWTDDELAQSLSPNATWAGCADAPGAFSCDGVRWSPHVAPLPTAPDDGQGWRGHALVRARYPDLFD
jgi:hypothetical protein